MLKFKYDNTQQPIQKLDNNGGYFTKYKLSSNKQGKKKSINTNQKNTLNNKKAKQANIIIRHNPNGNKMKWTADFKVYTSNSDEIKNMVYKNPSLPHAITEGFKMFKRKTALEYLLTMIQYPSPFKINPGLSIFLNLSEKFRIQVPAKQLLLSFNNGNQQHKISKQLLIKAVQIFFKRGYEDINLFYEPEFNFFKRSKNLQYTILACGLTWMEQTEEVKKTLNYFDMILFKQFSKLYLVKPSLENLQCQLLIMMYLSNFKWATMMRVRLTIHVQSIAIILGLHIENNSLPLKIRLERKLAYSAVVFYSGSVILTCGSHMISPYKVAILNEDDLINNNTKDLTHLELKVIMSKFISQFCLEIGSILYLIRILKEHYVLSDISEKELNTMSLKIRSQVEQSNIKWVTLLYRFKLLDKQNQLNSFKANFEDKIIFLCNFCHYFILTFKFYQPLPTEFNYNPNPTKEEIETKRYRNSRKEPNNKTILKTLHHACQVIKHIPMLENPIILPPYLIPFIYQTLTFMMRHYKKVKCEQSEVCIQMGLNKIKEVEEKVKSMWLFKFDTNIIKVISNLTKE